MSNSATRKVKTVTVADRIVAARKKLEISDAELARRLDVTRSTVFDWVHGVHEPNLESLRRLAGVLECTVSDLLGES